MELHLLYAKSGFWTLPIIDACPALNHVILGKPVINSMSKWLPVSPCFSLCKITSNQGVFLKSMQLKANSVLSNFKTMCFICISIFTCIYKFGDV